MIVGLNKSNTDEATMLQKEKEGQEIVSLSYPYGNKLATINKL